MIDNILVRGAKVHNLKNIDVDIPLHKIVGIAGVSGSGKSSLALGILYAEGSRRYLEALSTYTRRRMTQASEAAVDEVLYVPAALALRQRPGVPGIRSTFGTGTELLNSLRLMYSRLASHRCPNGHYAKPSLAVAAGKALVCPECGVSFYAPAAEELAFNSQGACPECSGTGMVRTVDMNTLVPDDSLTIDEGAVAPWNSLMWSLMTDVCREMGVRTDIPFRDLTEKEKEIVYHGPAEKKHILYQAKKSNQAGELDFTYYNAVYTVKNALAKVKDEKGMKRVEKFLKEDVCPVCHGTRLSQKARYPKLRGITLDEACTMALSDLVEWVQGVPESLQEEMRPMAESICSAFTNTAKRLLELGLGYLSLDRSAATLSTGERQRMQLARAVRNRTTGVLYVMDEPSIGLHPSNIKGLTGVMNDLVADGNSIILVDHDTQILKESDWIVEMGPQAGAEGGYVIAQGTTDSVMRDPVSQIGPFLSGEAESRIRHVVDPAAMFEEGSIYLSTGAIHTVKPLEIQIPKSRLTAVCGVSGSGKTTLLNCISTIDTVSAGHILLDGKDITTISEDDISAFRRDNLGFVFQDFNLLDTLTLEENIALPLTIGKMPPKEITERINHIAQRLQISDTLKKFPFQVSGGQKQRCAFARAMICNPKLVMADEPTGSLDSNSARILLQMMSELNKETGATILMVTHDAFCASYADRILFLKDGKIFNEILKGEKTRDIFYHEILDVLSLLGGDNPC